MTTQEEAYVPQAIGPKEDEAVSGFIFMCNRGTKPECYRYRVFGLPAARAEMLERIAPGTALFLFDFEVKLLYGVYTATSFGRMNLEPDAFGGRFPAQVGFKILEDCLPIPEHSFRRAILENYTKGKFKQELNGQQVRNLLLLFRPFTMPSSVHRHPVVVNTATLPSSQLNPRFIAFRPHQNYHNEPGSQHTGSFLELAHPYQRVGQHTQPDTRPSFLGDSFAAGRHFNHAQTVLPAESALRRSLSSQVTYSRYVTDNMGRNNVPSEQQTFPRLQQPYLPQEPAGSLADPRYMMTGQAALGNQLGATDSYDYQASSQSKYNSEPEPENSNQYCNHYYQVSSQSNTNSEPQPQPENSNQHYNHYYQVPSQSESQPQPENSNNHYNHYYQVPSQCESRPQPENSSQYYNHHYQASSQSNVNGEPQPQLENSNQYYNNYYPVASQSNVDNRPQPHLENQHYNHYYQVPSQSNVNSEPQPQPENSNQYYNNYYQVPFQSNVNSEPQLENSNRYYSYPYHLNPPAIAHDPTQQQLYAASGNTGHASATFPVS